MCRRISRGTVKRVGLVATVLPVSDFREGRLSQRLRLRFIAAEVVLFSLNL